MSPEAFAYVEGGAGTNLRTGRARAGVRTFVDVSGRSSLTWDQLEAPRRLTRLPVVVKAVLHPDDARRAVEYGADGIVVSNHGGRQIDGEIASLGARAVLIGRPYAYGLALAGQRGVQAVVRNFVAELDLTMALAGCASVAGLTPDLLVG
jgi:lactate 2-monooxygenase